MVFLVLCSILFFPINSISSPYVETMTDKRAVRAYQAQNYYMSYALYSDIYKKSPHNTFIYAEHFFNGYGVKIDKIKALALYKESANEGDSDSISFLIGYYDKGTDEHQKWLDVSLKKMTSNQMYKRYLSVKDDPDRKDEAFYWLKASSKKDMGAIVAMGNAYRDGDQVMQNFKKAISWYEKAANAGNVEAQMILGNAYASGQMVSRNFNKAEKWYKLAGCAGNLDAAYNAAYIHYMNKHYMMTNAWLIFAKYKTSDSFIDSRFSKLYKAYSKKMSLSMIKESQEMALSLCL